MGEYDIALRTFARIFAAELVQGLWPPGTDFKVLDSSESQVTERERRLDKSIKVLINGEEVILHVEFQVKWETNLSWRMFEYHNLLAFERHDSDPKTPTPIRSVVILLTGPEDLGSLQKEYRTSLSSQPFCGVRYEIEPVYKLTLEELEKRESLMWLAFAPLTVDVDEAKIKELLKRLENRFGSKRDVAEIAAAMTVVGKLNNKYKTMSDSIARWIGKELIMETVLGEEFWEGLFRERFENTFEERFEERFEKRFEKEKEELTRQVEEKVTRQIEKNNLFDLFSVRLGGSLTEEEKVLIDSHFQKAGFNTIFRAVLNITDGTELRKWLVTFDSSTS